MELILTKSTVLKINFTKSTLYYAWIAMQLNPKPFTYKDHSSSVLTLIIVVPGILTLRIVVPAF